MTTNQLRWWELQENKRKNLANETETHRSNVAKEGLTEFQNLETQRSNLANEQLKADTLAETKRSNLAKEAETNRSNLAKELEINRSNVVKEQEIHRSNVVNEDLKRDAHNLAVHQTELDDKHRTWGNINNSVNAGANLLKGNSSMANALLTGLKLVLG